MSELPPLVFQAPVADWGWQIAWFFWFVAIGGGLAVAYWQVRRAAVAFTVFVATAVGLLLVFFHLGRWWNMPVVLWELIRAGEFNFGSWMFLGVIILTVHLLLGALVSYAHADDVGIYPPFGDRVREMTEGTLFRGVFAASGVLAVVYSGFLLTQAHGIPLWGTALIPILWLISSAVAAVAVLELFDVLGLVDERVSLSGMKLGLGLDALKLIAVLAFLHVSLTAMSAAARAGAQEMVAGSLAWLTWGGVIGLGLAVPILFAALMLRYGKSKGLIAVSAVSSLAGVLFLRASVLLAGAWEPLLG